MSTLQLDFFAKTAEDLAFLEIGKFKGEVSSLRRSMFARHGELYKAISDLQKIVEEQQKEIERIKNNSKETILKIV